MNWNLRKRDNQAETAKARKASTIRGIKGRQSLKAGIE
jgi:hypothetical protein